MSKEEKVPTRLFIYPLVTEPVKVSEHPSLEEAIQKLRAFEVFTEKKIGFYILKPI